MTSAQCLLAAAWLLLAAAGARPAEPAAESRPPADDADLRAWLENMVVFHRFTPAEAGLATGLGRAEIEAAVGRFGLAGKTPPPRGPGAPLRVLPYPGGRHPRTGFLDGAVNPQRETKVSVFTPWDDTAHVVADVPEAIWSNLGLTYLAHTHIDTIWSARGVTLPRLEWRRDLDGSLTCERTLPNGLAFGTTVRPGADAVRMELWLRNGTPEQLTGLRVQNCLMLRGAPEFAASTNRVFRPPFAAAGDGAGRRWVITAWEPLYRAWANPPVPCIHADPQFPDCAPGETVRVRGWLSFFAGADVAAEFARIEAAGWQPAGR
ncbi:MAG: hypothetical protein ACKVYV_16630 [Limisphaerales bacterium]